MAYSEWGKFALWFTLHENGRRLSETGLATAFPRKSTLVDGRVYCSVINFSGVPSMYVCGRTARDVRKAVAALDGSARALGFDLLLLGRNGWAQSRDLETARPQDIPETMLRGVFGG
jgi:hypothetical protein